MNVEDLINTYPYIFENCFEFECPNTWIPKIEQLCRILTAHGERINKPPVQIHQIKVKFSQARIYPFGVNIPKGIYNWFDSCERACNKIGL